MRRFVVALAIGAVLTGCAVAPEPPTVAPPSIAAPTAAPEGGMLLSEVGFQHAPAGFSVPESFVQVERIDQVNNITLVVSQPEGAEFAQYLREYLPAMGYGIVADNDDSLIFENAQWVGGFTVTGELSALTLRTDAEPFETP